MSSLFAKKLDMNGLSIESCIYSLALGHVVAATLIFIFRHVPAISL